MRAAGFKGIDSPGPPSDPSLEGAFYVEENPGTYLEVENTGEGPATAVIMRVEGPGLPGGLPWLEEGFSRVIPLVDAGDGFTVSLSAQPLMNTSGSLEGFIEYYSLDGTRHELDLSGIPVIIDEGENETDPEDPYVYPPPPGDRGIWTSFRSFEVTLDGWRATVKGEMDILSAPVEISYTASVPVSPDGVIEVSLRSYARNRLGHQSIVASRPMVIPREGP